MPTLKLNEIIVEGRLREDLGDVEALAESIRDNGLLQPIVVEEIEVFAPENDPTFLGTRYELRAGGRRYAASTLLMLNKVPHNRGDFYDSIEVKLLSQMAPHQRIKIELEENLRRKDMTWLEKVEGIVKYHQAAQHSAAMENDTWSQQETGSLLNLDQSSVSVAFTVYKAIKKGNTKVAQAESLTEAIKIIAGDKLDEAQAERLRRIQVSRVVMATAPAPSTQLNEVGQTVLFAPSKPAELAVAKANVTLEQVESFYYHGDALELLPLLAKTVTINHIICDPPYGIDMDNLGSDSISRISETHGVEANLQLIPAFLKVSYNCIAEDGFLCMWYDLDHHEKIATWAKEIGWLVTRWPLTWCKTSPCSNQTAQYNITKATEVCYLFRRSAKSIIKKKQSINYVLAGGASTSTHPFTKPKEVWDFLIETVSTEGQTIVDPFAGEGSALAAIFQAKRNPIGVEIDERHIASGLSYIQSKLNKKDILDDLLSSSII